MFGLLLRLFFLHRYAQITDDAVVYGDLARNLLRHHTFGFSLRNGGVLPTLIRLPGYPLFLAGCFLLFGAYHFTGVLLVQIALDLVTCLLCAGVAGRWFGPRAALIALWMSALCPFTANYSIAPLTETLVLFTIALAFYSLDRWCRIVHTTTAVPPWQNRWLFVLAFALAASLLLRPDQGLLAAVTVPAVFFLFFRELTVARRVVPIASLPRRLASALKPALLLAILTLLPLVPWTARNWRTFHVFQPLAPRYANDPGEFNPYGFQRWYRTWAIDFASTDLVYWHFDGVPISVADLPNRAFDSQAQYAATAAVLDAYNDTNSASPQLDARFGFLAAERVSADPLRYYVVLPIARVFNMLFRPRADLLPVPLEWWRWRGHWRSALFCWSYAALNLAYFALAGITLTRKRLWGNERPIVHTMLAFILLRCALLLTVDNSEPRYTLEFFPILIVLGAAVFAHKQLPDAL